MPSGFVITVSCEEFFEDARKNIALYFRPDSMKMAKDLKLRLQCLIKQDFFLLWKPHGEESYYYLLDDEELHFLQSRDKFRLSKMNEPASAQLSTEEAHPIHNNRGKTTINLEEDKVQVLEQVDSKKDETENKIDSEELFMEYEDVVDNSTRKRRKRVRKHKSKKQKIETNENITGEPTMDRIDQLNCSQEPYRPVQHSETNGRSHIRFQTEDSSATHSNKFNHSQTTENVEDSEGRDVKIDYELYEVDVKKKKKKSKKAQVELCEASESTLENVASSLTSTPIHDNIINDISFSNKSNVIASTALSSPMSNGKPKRQRRSHTNSLANFITQLSSSLSCKENSGQDAEPSESGTNKSLSDVSSQTLDTKPGTSPNNLASCPNKSYNESDLSNTHRRLGRKNNTHKIDRTYNHTVLEQLQQFKLNNFPNMPLVFERRRGIEGLVQSKPCRNDEAVDTSENKLMNTEESPESVPISNGINKNTPISTDVDQNTTMSNGIDTNNPSSNNVEERIAQIESMSEDQVASLPPLREPKDNDVVIFKVLKMDASYNPTLSSYVCGKVKSVCKVTSQLLLDILHGQDELVAPQGKFSLDQEECSAVQTEYSINWNELYETRLLAES